MNLGGGEGNKDKLGYSVSHAEQPGNYPDKTNQLARHSAFDEHAKVIIRQFLQIQRLSCANVREQQTA